MDEYNFPVDSSKSDAAIRLAHARRLVEAAHGLIGRALWSLQAVKGCERVMDRLRRDESQVDDTAELLLFCFEGGEGDLSDAEKARLAEEEEEHRRRVKARPPRCRDEKTAAFARLAYQAGMMAPVNARLEADRILLWDLWTAMRPWSNQGFAEFKRAMARAHNEGALTLSEAPPHSPLADGLLWPCPREREPSEVQSGTPGLNALDLNLTARDIDLELRCGCDLGFHADDCAAFWDGLPRELQDEEMDRG